MPIYEYKCDECGHVMECEHSIDDRDKPHHCICHKDSRPLMKRTYNAPGISFKGAGFYSTDTRKKPKE